jgi:solute carrier family 25 (adenine nucleotide translocator) protein 4/5/6/31
MSPGASSSSSNTQGKTDLTKFVRDFMLGGVSGAIAKTLSAPIERVKLLLQTQHNNPKLAERPYNGILDCFSRCIKE